MGNLKSKHESQIISRKIILLDGREVNLPLFKSIHLYNHDNLKFNIHLQHLEPDNDLHYAFANILLDLLTTHSITYVATASRALKHWFEIKSANKAAILDIDILESLVLINHNYYPFIPPLLRRISRKYPHLITSELEDFLRNSQSWEEKKPAYFRLIANDPEKGALTSQELASIHSALNLSFGQKKLSPFDFTLCWFFIATGVRPVQVSRLKINSIQIINQEVMIQMPLAKAEGAVHQGFMVRKAPSILAECLIKFLNTCNNRHPDESVFGLNPLEISKRIINIFDSLDTYSSRLEGQIPVNAYRFRYTLATRAIIEGASDLEVARLLTHRSTSCIQFYRASLPDLQKPIQNALDEEMSFFAHAFKGKFISSLNEASIENSAIYDFFYLHGKILGSCGTHAKCRQNAPIACLTCSYFEPLISAPWEELLKHLLADQNRELEERIRKINQPAIDAIKEIISHSSVKEL
ncbi:site-specific integrase [Acinetobacter radioresistens]|uniref:site-specific integrase n=1 Tax=Acinetobacter radioresistens TaxID=40216 RepID=UPI0022456C4B|nr:site-specific integrase [Acinetobacter radioresistens]MCX0339446.1 site-specific integrase [Acinetobacter radioresistens]